MHLRLTWIAGIGIDRAAILIQQSRDHGIASYNQWRGFCGLPKAKMFEDLTDVMTSSLVNRLKSVYKWVSTPADIILNIF